MLSQREIDQCVAAFHKYDVDHSGYVALWELQKLFDALGRSLSSSQLQELRSKVEDEHGLVGFSEFLRIVELHKVMEKERQDDSDMIDAFIAMGGNTDKTGSVKKERLQAVFSYYGLTVDLEAFFQTVDTDNSGDIDYEEFATMFRQQTEPSY